MIISPDTISPLFSCRSLRPTFNSRQALTQGLIALGDVPEELLELAVKGGHEVIAAQEEHFPENIFYDLSYVVLSILEQALVSENAEVYVKDSIQRLIWLHELFGRHSQIRFQYVHDFIYGYDWVKWVQRDSSRAKFHPFGLEFLSYMEQRGQEMLSAIEAGDTVYHPLPKEGRRNVFGFSRDIASEEKLMMALAEADELPINAWESHPSLDWQKPYFELRRNTAERLGLLDS